MGLHGSMRNFYAQYFLSLRIDLRFRWRCAQRSKGITSSLSNNIYSSLWLHGDMGIRIGSANSMKGMYQKLSSFSQFSQCSHAQDFFRLHAPSSNWYGSLHRAVIRQLERDTVVNLDCVRPAWIHLEPLRSMMHRVPSREDDTPGQFGVKFPLIEHYGR